MAPYAGLKRAGSRFVWALIMSRLLHFSWTRRKGWHRKATFRLIINAQTNLDPARFRPALRRRRAGLKRAGSRFVWALIMSRNVALRCQPFRRVHEKCNNRLIINAQTNLDPARFRPAYGAIADTSTRQSRRRRAGLKRAGSRFVWALIMSRLLHFSWTRRKGWHRKATFRHRM